MVAGTFIAPGMDAIAKYLGDSLSPVMVTWGRFVFQSLLMAAGLMFIGGVKSLRANRFGLHMFRGVLLATATLCFFWALQHMPLAECIAIFFVQPMMLTLMAAWFLGEPIGWHRRLAVMMGFVGALIIIRPGADSFTIYYFLPLLAALFYASYLIVTRAHATEDTPAVQQFASGVGGAIFLSVLLVIAQGIPNAWTSPWPDASQWAWIAAIGLIASIAHLFVVMGMARAHASVLAPFGYSEIIAATLLGWWVFGDWPDNWTWFGVLIIVLSGLYVAWRETRASAAIELAPPSTR